MPASLVVRRLASNESRSSEPTSRNDASSRSPWLVSNGKLRAEGWSPTVTNEQSFVEGTETKWWTMLTPKRKQELALGVMIAAVVGVVIAVVRVLRRR